LRFQICLNFRLLFRNCQCSERDNEDKGDKDLDPVLRRLVRTEKQLKNHP
jgi:hypothetical protein